MPLEKYLLIIATASLSAAQAGLDSGPPQIATFQWDCAQSAGTCNNACFHVRCRGLQNVLPLAYDANVLNRPQRRAGSGCSLAPCKNIPELAGSGDSCDDFPFASMQQGGVGATMRCVPFSENSNQGDQLGAFREGIQHGQQFDISLINFQNSPFCLETTDCQNDGYEFIQQDGIFYYASSVSQQPQNQQPQGLNARDTSDDLSDATDNYFFRRYLGVDGVKRLHLPAHPGKSLVGRNVIAADGSEIAIVDEVVS